MAIYHRFTNGDVDNGCGFMMCTDRADKNAHYGKNHYIIDTANIPNVVYATDMIEEIAAMLREREDITESYDSGHFEDIALALAEDMNPENIVDTAGFWDAQDLVSWIWEAYLEPRGIDVRSSPTMV